VETNNELDLELIASKCGIALGKSPDEVIRNVVNLEEYYEKNELIKINNYFLTVENNPQILTFLITNEKKFNNEETLPILIDLLLFKSKPKEINQDDYINVRVMCAKAIAHYKNTSVIAPLLYCLNNKDEHYKIRLACADVLGKIGDKYAVTPLINLLNDEEEKSMYIKESAVSALGKLGDNRAIEPLVSILESKQGFWGKFSFLKEQIIETLGKFNNYESRIMKAMKNSLFDSSPMVRINAVEFIMNSNSENSYDLIKPSLKDEDDEVKRNALIALYNIVGRDILDEVLSEDEYSEFLKNEAQSLIDEYETDDEYEE